MSNYFRITADEPAGQVYFQQPLVTAGSRYVSIAAPVANIPLTIADGNGNVQLTSRGTTVPGVAVPTFRAATTNLVTRLDIMPNGSPTPFGSDNSLSALDICNVDLIANPAADGNYFHFSLDSTTYRISGAALGAGGTLPLIIQGVLSTTFNAAVINTSGGFAATATGVNMTMGALPSAAGYIGSTSNSPLAFYTNSASRGQVTAAGSWVLGSGALATNATVGFVEIPTMAGAPTGVPTTVAGMVSLTFDTTDNRLYFYTGGAWHYMAMTA